MLKRFVGLLLVFVLVLGMVPVTAQAAEVITLGQWCPGISYICYADGTLEYSGKGVLLATENLCWEDVCDATRLVIGDGITAIDDSFVLLSPDIVSIEIADTVKSIGSSAFIGCNKLTTVDIGDGVESIGERCFQDCESLKDVKLGAKLKTIGEMAFVGTGIETITIPSGVTAIGDSAFAGTALKSVTIPASVKTFGKGIFYGCNELTDVTVASSVVPIYAFEKCEKLNNVKLLSTVTKIEDNAFIRSGLTSITIPGSVLEIGACAFSECGALKNVTIEEGVRLIGDSAFFLCEALESIALPASVTSIGDSAFNSCSALKEASFANPDTKFSDNVFAGCPQDLTLNIGGNAGIHSFGDCGNNVTWTYYYDGRLVFSGTGELNAQSLHTVGAKETPTKIIVDDGITAIGEMVFYYKDHINIVSVEIAGSVKTIGERAFAGNENLATVTLHEGTEVIGARAFANLPVDVIHVPNSVHTIGDAAFYNCENLTEIYIGTGLKNLGDSVFLCDPLQKLVLKGDAPKCGQGDLGTCGDPVMIYYDQSNPTWTDEYRQYHLSFACDSFNFINCDVNSAGELVPHVPTQEEVYQILMAQQPAYPEGMPWGDEQEYVWDANRTWGKACAAFAMRMNDLAFGDVPAKEMYLQINIEDLRVGDMLCYWSSPTTTHAVVILEVYDDHVVIVEGNYDGKVHWGRTMSKAEVESAYCYYTRYYEETIYIQPDEDAANISPEVPTFSTNAAVVSQGSHSNGELHWVYYDDGTVVISGTGEIPSGWFWESPWTNAKKVVIMGGVTNIADHAFANMHTLEHVVIAGTVKSIGESAFYLCENLKEVQFYQGIRYIEDAAFAGAEQLKKVVLPDSVETLGSHAFGWCYNLNEVVIGKSMNRIKDAPFYNCKLRKITFRGDAPECGLTTFATSGCFDAGTAEIYFPLENPTWTQRFLDAHASHYTSVNVKWIGYDASGNFVDVPAGKFYTDAVAWAVERGITKGETETEFRPDKDCTRGQVMTFIWRANGCPEPKSMNHSFTDLDPNKFYYKAVIWAVEQGITTGKTATTFEPNATCTRSQVVTFLWRSAGKPAPVSANSFPDVGTDAYYYQAVLWAVEQGITNGFKDGTFGPTKFCNRGQIVTFLYRDMN